MSPARTHAPRPAQRRKPKGNKGLPAEPAIQRRVDGTSVIGDLSFPVVGVGASAGGLAAVTDLLKHLPRDVPVAVVVVQHLDPKHDSLTSDILSRISPMPVTEVVDGMRIQPHHVYVIPPNTTLRLSGAVLKLLPREARGQHLPIDLFFRSLAEEKKEQAVGVVLSGIASDGTAGVQAIKAEGGFTFAQDPVTAQYDGMPRSAIHSGAVDVVEAPEKIAGEIAKIAERFPVTRGPRPVEPAVLARGPNGNLRKIFALIRNGTGVDFTHYKHSTIQRRIARRLFLRKIEDLQTYADYLGRHPDEVQALFSDILIHVTGFFRDPQAYESLITKILPKYLEHCDPSVAFRVWVPGCSSGEEAYSIGMSFFEALDKLKVRPSLQIFASDISEAAVQRARAAVYPDTIGKDVSKARLNRFFERVAGGGYRIAKWLRDTCLFSRQDLTADPPFAKIDLISCRNVLIYFNSDLQKRVVPILHYSLSPGGILWLGRSETISGFSNLFALEDRANKFYSKKVIATPLRVPFPVTRQLGAVLEGRKPLSVDTSLQVVQVEADRVALEQYVPSSVVISDSGDILQVRGRPAPYLELTSGQASLNVFKLAHPDILSDLRFLLNAARKRIEPVRKDGLSIEKNGKRHTLGIRIVPLHGLPETTERYFSIFFEEAPVLVEPSARVVERRETRSTRKQRLEREQKIDAERRYQQELIEEYETTQEELVSSNEELQSTNEELQSTNEELETAKEELQSANEEMTTINDELQTRNAESTQITNDLTNLLASVDLAIVMVGPDGRIRRFTPKAGETLNLIPGDVGRSIGDIKPAVQGPDLDDMVAEVTKSLTMKEEETQDKSGTWYRLQVRPYRTADNRIDGAVIALADITELKRSGEVLKKAAADARAIVEAMPTAMLVLTSDRRVQIANQAFYSLFQLKLSETEGRHLSELGDSGWNIPSLPAMLDKVLTQATPFHDMEVEQDFARIGPKSIRLHATATRLESSELNVAVLAVDDLTAGKQTAARLQSAELELEREKMARETAARQEAEQANQVKDEFLATLSHELRTPLSTIFAWVQLLRLSTDAAKRAEAVAAIERSVKAQTQLIEDLLDISRIRVGKLHLDLRDVDPMKSIRASVDSVLTLAEASGITLLTELDQSVCRIHADPLRLEQVLRNLLTNAIKFTSRGGTVTVRSRSQTDPEQIEIQVQDTGRGIKAEFLPNVFTRFSQQESSTTRAAGGLGLGLSIVKNLVELHNGSVKAESPGEGKGAVFTVILPCAKPDAIRPAATGANTVPEVNTQRDDVASLTGIRVLVIDDLIDAREALSALLQSMGAEVQAVESVAQGLDALGSFKPDVVLCDIALPGEDGFSFIRRLRALTPGEGGRTPTAALSAYAGAEHTKRSLEAGFDLHLAKPTDAADLSHAILKLTSRRIS